MKHCVMAAVMACMWLSGTTFAMAAASDKAALMREGIDNGAMASDSLNSATVDDLYHPDDSARQSSSNDAMIAECERLLARGRIGQRGQTRGSEVTLVGRNCDRLFDGSSN